MSLIKRGLKKLLGKPETVLFYGLDEVPRLQTASALQVDVCQIPAAPASGESITEPVPLGTEILEDRHPETGQNYRTVLELRAVKNNYLINQMPKLVKNYLLIRYEDLRDLYDSTMMTIACQFRIPFTGVEIIPIKTYKGRAKTRRFDPRPKRKQQTFSLADVTSHPDFNQNLEPYNLQ